MTGLVGTANAKLGRCAGESSIGFMDEDDGRGLPALSHGDHGWEEKDREKGQEGRADAGTGRAGNPQAPPPPPHKKLQKKKLLEMGLGLT